MPASPEPAAPPAPAPAAAPAPAPTPTPAAVPKATGPTQVSAATIPDALEIPRAKPGSAKAKMFEDMAKKRGLNPQAPTEPTPPAAKEPEPAPEPAPEPKAGDEPPVEPQPTPEPKPAPADKGGKPGKVSPWKLVDEHKAARLAAEQQLAELRKQVPDPAAIQQQADELKSTREKLAQLEKTLGYLDYSQTEEFKRDYVAPYENEWKKAARELSEITVNVPGTDQVRPATPEDLLALVNLPLGQALGLAKEAFGDFADHMMGWRGKLKDLFDRQQDALAKAREAGGKWKSEQANAVQAQTLQVQKTVSELWQRANTEVLADPKHGRFLSETKDDTQANERLKKGYALADEAFSLNPLDPNLPPDKRERAVRLHSALRNRAAAYSRLVYEVEKLEKALAEVTKERDGLKGSAPPRTPSASGSGTPAAGSVKGMARIQAELAKIARPGA